MTYLTGIKLTKDFDEHAYYDYHQGSFDNQDEFYQYFIEYIERETIPTYHCKDIIEALNYDVFAIHDVYGQAKSWKDAAFAALYDHLMDTGATFDEIYNEVNENV